MVFASLGTVAPFMNAGGDVQNPRYPYMRERVSSINFFVLLQVCCNLGTYLCFTKGYNDHEYETKWVVSVKLEPLVPSCKMCINCKKHGSG